MCKSCSGFGSLGAHVAQRRMIYSASPLGRSLQHFVELAECPLVAMCWHEEDHEPI
jgi:hypothetical protein